MFGLTRWSPFDDFFTFHREVDRLFTQLWNDLPTRTAASSPGTFQVNTSDEAWRIDVPLPGVAPQNVALEVAGNMLTIRVEESDRNDKNGKETGYEQSITIPQFLDVDKLKASHRHGMLELTLPLKDSVKPRRIQIESATEDKKQLTAA